jgi:hypothetical protein
MIVSGKPVTPNVERPFEAAMPAFRQNARKNAGMAGQKARSTAAPCDPLVAHLAPI